MMSHISEMADELATEVLSEAAETFFGQRKDLESEIALFHKKAATLGEIGRKAILAQKIMHALLLEEPLIREFYQTLGLRPPACPDIADAREIAPHVSVPFAWTLRGRYRKLLFSSYTSMHCAIHEYLHGGYQNDPMDRRRKIAVFGYVKLLEWSQRINQKVKKMNTQQAPSEVLQFVKRLDVLACEMEQNIGASCDVNRDNGMLFSCVDFAALRLPTFDELPRPAEIRSRLRSFCKALFPGKASKIRGLLRDLGAG
jgi:hypothetical protein